MPCSSEGLKKVDGTGSEREDHLPASQRGTSGIPRQDVRCRDHGVLHAQCRQSRAGGRRDSPCHETGRHDLSAWNFPVRSSAGSGPCTIGIHSGCFPGSARKWRGTRPASTNISPPRFGTFPDQERLATVLLDAGFRQVSYRNLTGGIVAIHVAVKCRAQRCSDQTTTIARMNSILYIFLPCKKVYPIGVTYLADFIHRRKPDVRQRILDLSLFPDVATEPGNPRCRHRVQAGPRLLLLARHSDLFARTRVTLRWNMRSIFTLRAIRIKRVVASFAGLKQLYRYYSHIQTILSYPWLIAKRSSRRRRS